jgi:hypothetical protein
MDLEIIVECPHCKGSSHIEQINCGIFRHAVYKHNNEPIPPHTSKDECERLLSQNVVYGCAKPFKVIKNIENRYIAIDCDYI